MRRLGLPGWASAAGLVLLSCSSGPELSLGQDFVSGSGGAGGFGGVPATGGWMQPPKDAGRELSVHIENTTGLVIDTATLPCGGGCVDVRAVASGGTAPYTFVWENGGTNPARTICSAGTAAYRVSVTETGASAPEFGRQPRTVSAQLLVHVLPCRDGGSPPGDGGPPEPDTGGPSTCGPTAGFGLTCPTTRDSPINLLSPLEANRTYGFQFVGNGPLTGTWEIEIYGSADGCARGEKLSTLVKPSGWTTEVACMRPTARYTQLLWHVANATTFGLTPPAIYICDRCGP